MPHSTLIAVPTTHHVYFKVKVRQRKLQDFVGEVKAQVWQLQRQFQDGKG